MSRLTKFKASLPIYAIVLGIIIGLTGAVKYMQWKDASNKAKYAPVLVEGEKERILINKNTITHVTEKGIKVITGARRAKVTVTDDGEVKVESPRFGVIFEPGCSVFHSAGRVHVGLDAQWFYWSRFGLFSGFGFASTNDHFSTSINLISVGYTPQWKYMSNTSFFAGMDMNRSMCVGMRVRW